VLSHSTRPGVMRLLLAFLDDPHAPHAALTVLARRTDETFLRHLLKKLAADQSQQVRANLKRVESIPWLREDLRRLATLSEDEQSGVVFLAMASGLKRPHAFEVVQFLLRHGNVGGRRAASRELNEFKGPDANQAALAAIDDGDPEVQVNLLLQLRERGIPGAVTKLLELVDSPHPTVRQAVQHCLAEFSFKRYLAAFDQLPPDAKVNTGALVRKIDPTAIAQLCEELAAPVRARKLRAVEIVSCMGVSRQVEPSLIDLLADEEPFLRLEAAQLLANCDTPLTRQALRTALLDRHAGVQAAAEKSLRAITQQNAVSGLPSILGSVP
ncbi:MAG TPA: HEAT repeat domain-containing protein, partial [Pirellulaceae bacterium]|nr:HEAT repeat domain-containing protein [Pirellulaceae bacterium]